MITTSEQQEQQLIARAQAGDTHAFDILVSNYAPQIHRLALRMLGDAEEAEEALQETMIRAFRSLRKFRGDAGFGTWLYAIASKRCLTRRQRRRRQPDMVAFDDWRETNGKLDDPGEVLIQREHGLSVQRALNVLSPPTRLLMVLRYVEGLSHEEIAQVLGCTVAACRVRLCRAKADFRALLIRELDEDEL